MVSEDVFGNMHLERFLLQIHIYTFYAYISLAKLKVTNSFVKVAAVHRDSCLLRQFRVTVETEPLYTRITETTESAYM